MLLTTILVSDLGDEHVGVSIDRLSAAKLAAWPNYRQIDRTGSWDKKTGEARLHPSDLVIKKIVHRADGRTTIRFDDAVNNYVCDKKSTVTFQD